jgi:hypothetical protein
MGERVMNLAEFLLARVSDDQRDALIDRMTAEAGHGVLRWLPSQHYYVMQERQIEAANRVLAECEAKRQLIDIHRQEGGIEEWMSDEWVADMTDDERAGWCDWCTYDARTVSFPCEHLRILASVYRDHSDYQQEWQA